MAKNYDILNLIKKSKPYKCLYYAQSKQPNELVAVKTIDLDDRELLDKNEIVLILNEITRLKQLRHENIQQIYNSFTNNTKLYIVCPLMLYGSCKDILELQEKNENIQIFNEQSLQIISKSLLNAIDYIHSKHIIHRCICPKNVFISSSGQIVLSGFKFSVSLIDQGNLTRKLHDYPANIQEYISYLSPELLQQNLIGYNTKSDIYSFGVTICELANGMNPFVGCQNTQILLEKLIGPDVGLWDRTILNDESKINAIEVCSTENPKVIESIMKKFFTDIFRNFIDLCVAKNFHIRLNATQLLQHPYLKKLPRKNITEFLHPIQNLIEKPTKNKNIIIDDYVSENKDSDLWNFN